MTQYRWSSGVVHGRWCNTAQEALKDALRAGQAVETAGPRRQIALREFTKLEDGQQAAPWPLHEVAGTR